LFREKIFRFHYKKTSRENLKTKNALVEQKIMDSSGDTYFRILDIEWTKNKNTQKKKKIIFIKRNTVGQINA
jgi:hypothetical protein